MPQSVGSGGERQCRAASPDACLWSAETGRELHLLRHVCPVTQVEFSADGTRLLTVTKVYEYDGEDIARLWDAATSTLLQTFPPGNVRTTPSSAPMAQR